MPPSVFARLGKRKGGFKLKFPQNRDRMWKTGGKTNGGSREEDGDMGEEEMENTADRCGGSGGPGAGVRPQEAGLAGSGAG